MIIAFVQLGPNRAATLVPFASHALSRMPAANLVLITDRPRGNQDFPGRVVRYSESDRPRWIDYYERRHPVESSMARGFWVRSIERLFALRKLSAAKSEPLIHLESDVMSFVDLEIADQLQRIYHRPAVPRSTGDEACASILFSPSVDQLEPMLAHMEDLLLSAATPLNDMALLGMGLRDGVVDALPSHPNDATEAIAFRSEGASLPAIFDAAPYGGYLFGRDPVYSGGKSISGYIHPGLPPTAELSSWGLIATEDPYGEGSHVPTVRNGRTRVALAALHISAKYDPGSPEPGSEQWIRVLAEANGDIGRSPQRPSQRSVHNYGTGLRRLVRRAVFELPGRWVRQIRARRKLPAKPYRRQG